MSLPGSGTDVDPPAWATVASLLALGVVFAGVGDFLLARLGYPGVGAVVWVVGYGGSVLVVWLLFFRGREFRPGTVTEDDPGGEERGERNR